jgi:hypothetical protein
MKRIVIFCLLGPLLGWLVLWLVFEPRFILVGLFTLPWAYMFGVIPALMTACFDFSLATKLSPLPRMCVSAVAAAFATWLWAILAVIGFSYPEKWLPVLVGIGGGVAAAICSWLSSEKQHAGRA